MGGFTKAFREFTAKEVGSKPALQGGDNAGQATTRDPYVFPEMRGLRFDQLLPSGGLSGGSGQFGPNSVRETERGYNPVGRITGTHSGAIDFEAIGSLFGISPRRDREPATDPNRFSITGNPESNTKLVFAGVALAALVGVYFLVR